MKKLHNKIISACALGVIAAAPITASAVIKTITITSSITSSDSTSLPVNTISKTPASVLLSVRAINGAGKSAILTSRGSALPSISHGLNPFLGKN